jgi:hypothetical protein
MAVGRRQKLSIRIQGGVDPVPLARPVAITSDNIPLSEPAQFAGRRFVPLTARE